MINSAFASTEFVRLNWSITILDKINEKVRLPLPIFKKWKKMEFIID